MFTKTVCDSLKYYVYVYVDPKSDKIFYVGKGKGNRCFAHLKDTSDKEKARAIAAIKALGKEPLIEILVHGLEDEETALRVEAAVIDALGPKTLTNSMRGWESTKAGRMSIDEVASLYDCHEVKVTVPTMLIRINQLYRPGMSEVELYDATRGIWKVGPKRNDVKYAMAVFDGVVREVYTVEQWFPAGTTFSSRDPEGVIEEGRWEFVGRRAEARVRNKYRLKSVAMHFKQGMASPCVYVIPEK